jgi:F-type H+-transporting ATPase subunit b
MLIDWFTVGAQALNFLILVWLMKRYLYHPVLNAIDKREKRIAAQISDAEAKDAAANKERDDFKHKNDEFDKQRADLLAKATDEAKVKRQKLIEAARKDADAVSVKRDESLQNEVRNLTQAISQRTQQEVFSIVRKTLGDLATTSLEERMVDVFTSRLEKMDGPGKEKFAAAIKGSSETSVVRSAFELPPEEQTKVQDGINKAFSTDVHLRFEVVPEIVSGIELNACGQKLAWSIADYLKSLEISVEELLKKQEKPGRKAAPKPDAEKPPTEEKPKTEEPAPASS